MVIYQQWTKLKWWSRRVRHYSNRGENGSHLTAWTSLENTMKLWRKRTVGLKVCRWGGLIMDRRRGFLRAPLNKSTRSWFLLVGTELVGIRNGFQDEGSQSTSCPDCWETLQLPSGWRVRWTVEKMRFSGGWELGISGLDTSPHLCPESNGNPLRV